MYYIVYFNYFDNGLILACYLRPYGLDYAGSRWEGPSIFPNVLPTCTLIFSHWWIPPRDIFHMSTSNLPSCNSLVILRINMCFVKLQALFASCKKDTCEILRGTTYYYVLGVFRKIYQAFKQFNWNFVPLRCDFNI